MRLKCEGQSLICTEQRKTKSNPGPGAYTPNYSKTKASDGVYTIKGRHVIPEVSRAPGPGTYQAKDSPSKTAAPSYKFGTAA